MTPRKPTPDDILAAVSQETRDDVAIVVGRPRPASSRLLDVFAAEEGWPAVSITDSERIPELVPIAAIDDNPYQPRLVYSGIEELAENIRLNGLLQPLAGRMTKGGRWQAAFGHRRLRAYRLLHEQHGGDWGRIPMVVLSLTDDQMARHAWSENHNRVDVSAVEEARLFQRMMTDFGFTQQEIADDVGKSRSAVANTLRLLQLPEAAQAMIDAGQITERHGRELLRLANAPTWLTILIERLESDIKRDSLLPVSSLRKTISDYIMRNGTPLPDAPVTMENFYGDTECTPPPWPADYAPRSPDVHAGGCAGCAWLVTFDREPAGRCTDRKCYEAKGRLWKEKDAERQKAAARVAIAGQVDTSAPGKEVRWTTKDGYSTTAFGEANAPAALLERGLCGAEQCECFALMLKKNNYDLSKRMVGPDRQTAPNVVYVCENFSRLRARRNRLEEIEAPEKAEQRKQAVADKGAETKAAKALLKELWAEIGVEGLSSSQSAMATIAAAVSGSYFSDAKWREQSVTDLWDGIFWHIVGKSCKVVEFTSEGNGSERWVLAKAEQLRDQLRGERSRPATQPGPGDSQETGWQEGQTDEDEALYRTIKTHPALHLNDLDSIDAPRVLLRLIEDMGDNKPLRGKLWKRYNELVGDHPHPGPLPEGEGTGTREGTGTGANRLLARESEVRK